MVKNVAVITILTFTLLAALSPAPILAKSQMGNSQIISAGANYSLSVHADGTLWAWGGNRCGQLGDGTTTDRYSPVQIGTDNGWMAVAAGTFHSFAVKLDGTLWAWGENVFGKIGDGTKTERHRPVQIRFDDN